VPAFEVQGQLAVELKRTQKIAKLGKWALAGLVAMVGAGVVTGGVSTGLAAAAAALTGIEISAIILATSIGISTILAVYRGYNVETRGPYGLGFSSKKG